MYKATDGVSFYSLHDFMLTDLFPDVLEGDRVISGKFELRTEEINLNSLEIKTTFTEEGVNKTAGFPMPVRELMDIPAFTNTLLNMLASKPGAVPPTITIQENKDAVGETVQETVLEIKPLEIVVTTEESFSEEERNQANETKNNCILPNKRRPTSRIAGKNSKK